jgi:hypothetical protein
MAWREDHRRVSNGEQYLTAVNATSKHPVSKQWKATGSGVSLMENEHTLNALLRKQADLAGQFEHYQAKARQPLIDLDSVDATIRLFAPDMDLSEVKPKPMPP